MKVLFTDVRLEFLSENVRPAIFLFPFCAIPASVFLHIITIWCQAVCKHHAAFAIGLFVQIVPLSVHEYPAALHACLRIKIEPAAISAVADPSGRCVAVLAESPPVSIDRNPLMRSSNCIISGCSCPGTFAIGCSLRIDSVFVEELITSVVVYPVAESIIRCSAFCQIALCDDGSCENAARIRYLSSLGICCDILFFSVIKIIVR